MNQCKIKKELFLKVFVYSRGLRHSWMLNACSPSKSSSLLPLVPVSPVTCVSSSTSCGLVTCYKAYRCHLSATRVLLPVLPHTTCRAQLKPSLWPHHLLKRLHLPLHSYASILTNLQWADYIHSVRESLPPANIFIEFHKLGHSWIIYSTLFQWRVHKSLKCWQNA